MLGCRGVRANPCWHKVRAGYIMDLSQSHISRWATHTHSHSHTTGNLELPVAHVFILWEKAWEPRENTRIWGGRACKHHPGNQTQNLIAEEIYLNRSIHVAVWGTYWKYNRGRFRVFLMWGCLGKSWITLPEVDSIQCTHSLKVAPWQVVSAD